MVTNNEDDLRTLTVVISTHKKIVVISQKNI